MDLRDSLVFYKAFRIGTRVERYVNFRDIENETRICIAAERGSMAWRIG